MIIRIKTIENHDDKLISIDICRHLLHFTVVMYINMISGHGNLMLVYSIFKYLQFYEIRKKEKGIASYHSNTYEERVPVV